MKRRGFLAGLAASVAGMFGARKPELPSTEDAVIQGWIDQAKDIQQAKDIEFTMHFDPSPPLELACSPVSSYVWKCTYRDLRGQAINLGDVMKDST